MMAALFLSDSVADCHADWLRLWATVSGSPFLHPGWHGAFVESHAAGLEPRLVGIRTDGRLSALLPLRKDADGVLRFLTSPRSDYEDALVTAEEPAGNQALNVLVDFLLKERFELNHLPEGSRLARALEMRGLKSRPSAPCPRIRLSSEVVADIGGRDSIRRHEKKLSKQGTVRLVVVEPDRRAASLDHLMDLHIARWLAAGDDSLFLDPRCRDFYHRLVAHREFEQFGVLHALECGDRPVAYHVGLTDGESFVWYKPSFDPEFHRCGPGEVLMKRLVQSAHASGNRFFDFSRGDEPFKARFANEIRHNRWIGHRLPFLPRLRNALAVRVARLRKRVGPYRRGIEQALRRPVAERFFQVSVPEACPADPPGFVSDWTGVDPVAFARLRRWRPDYVTSDRLKSLERRHQRGDRLLTIVREEDRVPVHFSWLRVDHGVVQGDHAAEPLGEAPAAVVIHDCWTAPDARGCRLYPWAIRRLAWEGSQMGLPVWIYCHQNNEASLRGILHAGVVEPPPLPSR